MNFYHSILEKLKHKDLLIAVCPEVDGGMTIPRIPCELQKQPAEIFTQLEGVVNQRGDNMTDYFIRGVRKIDPLLEKYTIEFAILKEHSPSCGVTTVYDGTFTGARIPGEGLMAFYLRKNHIQVFSENQLTELYATLIRQKWQLN